MIPVPSTSRKATVLTSLSVNTLKVPSLTVLPLPLPPKPRAFLEYSGNYGGILSGHVFLPSKIDVLSSAVHDGRIKGFRYYNATTGTMKDCGWTGAKKKNLSKKVAKTKRKRVDFDHQISIFHSNCHVKLFQTGKMVIPACGSPEKAREAFELIANICERHLVKINCTNRNIRITFSEINVNDMFDVLTRKHACYKPVLGKTKRLKNYLWWNRNYPSNGVCKCQPESCLIGYTKKKKNDEFEGKCTRSTIMWGKKSVTIFGTNNDEQRLDIVKSLRELISELGKSSSD